MRDPFAESLGVAARPSQFRLSMRRKGGVVELMGKVELRLGRAGSGKSTQIATDIAAELAARPIGPKIFWLVPIENSYAAERLLMGRVASSLRAEVIHLQRLAERALPAQLPLGKTINATGKRLVLASVFHEALPKLRVLRRDVVTVPFLDSILEAFQELTSNLVPLYQLEGALESAAVRMGDLPPGTIRSGRSLLGKLADLSYLYIHFKQTLEGLGFSDADELLSQVEPYLQTWDDLHDSIVYVDGFSDLTPQELRFILAVAQQAKETVFSLSVDEDWLSYMERPAVLPFGVGETFTSTDWLRAGVRPDVYAPQTLALLARIMARCEEQSLKANIVRADKHMLPRFGQSADLAVLEQRLYEAPARKREVAHAHARRLQFAAAQNPRIEVDGVAVELSRLVREEPVRYSDVVVAVPSFEEYGAYLKDCFERHQIPFYMDVFPSFAIHPLAKLLLASLKVIQENFSTDALIRLLKSDFCGLERNQADRLETYLRRYEVSGKNVWLGEQPWHYAALRSGIGTRRVMQSDEEADRMRRTVATYLSPFAKAVELPLLQPGQLSYAMWDLLKATDAKRAVASWMVNDDAVLSPMEASMHEQAWQRTVELLNDLASFQDASQELPRVFLFELVEHHILSQILTTIPARLGDVLITEVHRTSALECEVLFLLGANDGSLPRRVESHGLLQDEERLQFARLFGARLGYTSVELQLCERLTVYTALTRAKSKLYLSYALANSSGKGASASQTLSRVKGFFPPDSVTEVLWTAAQRDSLGDLTPQVSPVENQQTQREYYQVDVYTPQTAMNALVESLRSLRDGGKVHPLAALFLDWAQRHSVWSARLDRALAGWRHQTQSMPLEMNLAATLYREPFTLTVYQIESFAACPFQHFVHFGLNLEPEESQDITRTAKGRLMHDVILKFVERQRDDWDEWRTMTDEQATTAMHEVFRETITSSVYRNWLEKAVRREQAFELETVLAAAAKVLTRHARYGAYYPAALELSFGLHDENKVDNGLPAFQWQTHSGKVIQLRGRIDRVDVALENTNGAFRVFDYKSSKRELDLIQVEYGLSLQLPVYAAVIAHFSNQLFGFPAKPAGIFYLPVYQEWKTSLSPAPVQVAEQSAIKAMRTRGIMVDEGSLIAWMDARLTQGEDSDLFAKVYNKDGEVAKSAPVVSKQGFTAMTQHALRLVEKFTDQILSGETSIAPAQLQGKQPACAFCAYAAICHIDRRVDGQRFRKLPRLPKEQVMENWLNATPEALENYPRNDSGEVGQEQ